MFLIYLTFPFGCISFLSVIDNAAVNTFPHESLLAPQTLGYTELIAFQRARMHLWSLGGAPGYHRTPSFATKCYIFLHILEKGNGVALLS